ncbi:MAG: Cof-type HAD-IIB family hydrolase [Oscillospiraceae bacterium]|jgi:Cof subfamily protein (haloacid dehalogenase superfamily)|nr:Cof-type HAD-IIB family hydrolase [Oscillospiraceae bacterium]
MRIQMIALDLDGTVLRNDKSISPRTLETLKQAAQMGVRIVPATGRVAKMVPEELLRLPGARYILTSNGANVIDMKNHSTVYSRTMTAAASLRLIRFLTERGLFAEAYTGGVSYSDSALLRQLFKFNLPEQFFQFIRASQTLVDNLPAFLEQQGALLEKVNIPYLPKKEKQFLAEEIPAMGPYSVTSSGYQNLEINAVHASKGDGLLHLCQVLGMERDRVMAFGDGDNDRTMLRFAGLGVAMGNAEPDLFGVADEVTDTNEEDGVAKAVEKYVLSQPD